MENRFPLYTTKTFNQVYEEADTFSADFKASGLYLVNMITDQTIALTFSLLSAYYGNSPIKNLSEEQFKLKVFATMFQYAPSWEKRLEIQTKLRALTDNDIIEGTKQISNNSHDPENIPTTSEELGFINNQNITKIKKNKIQAYSDLWDMIATDVTKEYVDQFKKLFKTFFSNDTVYVSHETEEEVEL